MKRNCFQELKYADRLLDEEGFGEWTWEQDEFFVKHSYLDYRPLIYQKFISGVLSVESIASVESLQEYRFNQLQYCQTNQGLLQQCLWGRTELANAQSLADAINALFKPRTRKHYTKTSTIFLLGHVVPVLA